ncbi:aquaporin [Variovorax terrae]|uniref:Aquaporin n=1 Tax=Variovorax terrae TaxID=2923278 RepID=A0A9X1VVZ2_9BURK|nr:aquaporin [Variovorax terrae]MCJ0763034.1 aquaporin [Variovorax terrae]
MTLPRQALAEFTGTAALLCAVIGSGLMAERLAGGNMALALLANTLATAAALYVLIELLGPVSGAHFNPLVTLVLAFKGPQVQAQRTRVALYFIASQLLGAVAGAWLAHAMFDLDILQVSHRLRGGWSATGQFTGWGQWLAEAVATAGLILVVLRASAKRAGALVACYIGAAYWFTASTSFANPAAVLGRMLSDSFAGIAPASAPGFVLAQGLGAVAGLGLSRWLGPLPGAEPAQRPSA